MMIFWEGLGNYAVYVISNRNASAIFEISKFENKVHTVDVNIFVMIEFECFNQSKYYFGFNA